MHPSQYSISQPTKEDFGSIQAKRNHDSVVHADNYSATYEVLHFKLFAEQKEGIRLIWEYVNMMYQDYDGNEFLKNYKSQLETFKRLSESMKKKESLVFSHSI